MPAVVEELFPKPVTPPQRNRRADTVAVLNAIAASEHGISLAGLYVMPDLEFILPGRIKAIVCTLWNDNKLLRVGCKPFGYMIAP
jgi:hypothetical protein